MTQFTTVPYADFTLVEFSIPEDTPLTPKALAGLQPPDVPGHKGVIISGRGPVWLYAFLAHHYHPTAWVATYDPRLGGAVVVARHVAHAPAVGSVVPVPN